MRCVLTLLLLLLAACAPEPSFDERFEETQERLDQKAKEIERELQQAPVQEDPPGKSEAHNRRFVSY